MPFFVAAQQQVPPDRLGRLVDAVRTEFSLAPRYHPGRRATRTFQHLHLPRLLTIGEWDSEDDFERRRRSFRNRKLLDGLDAPQIDPLTRLSFTGRMHLRSRVAAAATVVAPVETCQAVAATLTSTTRREIAALPGLVTHEIYQVRGDPCRLIALHTWESMGALAGYRREMSPRHEVVLAELGATFERFVGSLAAEFSVQDPRAG